jgi:hypothetical protein
MFPLLLPSQRIFEKKVEERKVEINKKNEAAITLQRYSIRHIRAIILLRRKCFEAATLTSDEGGLGSTQVSVSLSLSNDV